MKQCVNCGTPVEDAVRFCPTCGSGSFELPKAPEPAPVPKKKSKLPLILGIVAAVFVALFAAGVIAGIAHQKKLTSGMPDDVTLPAAADTDSSRQAASDPVSEAGEPAAANLSAGAVTAADSPVVFKQIGNLIDPEFSPYSIIDKDGDTVILNDPFGQNRLNASYRSYEKVDAAKGIFIVTSAAAEPNNTGLVNTGGKVYIPCETAGIKQINDRFLRVYYGTKKVDKEEDAMFFISDRMIAINYSEEDGDRLYAGYVRIYDLVDEKFVEGFQNDDPAVTIRGLTENFYTYNARTGVSTVYDASGKPVPGFPELKYISSNVDYVTATVGEETRVYDQNANLLLTSKATSISKVFGGKYYTVYTDESLYRLYDFSGREITKKGYNSIDCCGDQFIVAEKKNGSYIYGVIDNEGNTVLPVSASYITKDKPCTGFLWANNKEKNEYTLIYPDATTLAFDNSLSEGSYYEKDADGFYKIGIICQKGYVKQETDHVSSVGNFCVEIRNKEGASFLVDTFSGTQLTPASYSRITKGSNDCIYAQRLDDKSWDVFTIHENDYAAAQRVRLTLLTALEDAFNKEGIEATVDKETGEVALDSAVLFALDRSELSDEGKAFLKKFTDAYTGVVFGGSFEGYVDTVLIEGHTDSDGTVEHNLQLSQARADAVRDFCLSQDVGADERLQNMLSAVGVASTRTVKNADGTENKEASRRVSFTLIIVTNAFESSDS
ncbi:MAG: OmpA family protein [Clostridia bacterium]|nr:OmpA family protein [Clostridia bacterium]